jgi:asparagine synthase (glutamine-hydrolysing)
MCGIVCMYSPTKKVRESALRRASLALQHRGPDANKIWTSPDREIGLGHARLSIIDLSSGNQPLENEDGTIHAVVNGELYGHEDIRSRLESRGHRFATNSDSEVLVHLYEEYGAQCLEHLVGEFAFVLWDANLGRLFAARDRFGIKPLFYYRQSEELLFASEVKALIELGAPAVWDKKNLFQELCFLGSPQQTLFDGVSQLPAASFLLATDKALRIEKYWEIPFGTEEAYEEGSDASWIKTTRSCLVSAVKTRMRSDVPMGVYLSGGLDSSAVLGIAAEEADKPLDVFTIRFDQREFDEGPFAEEVCRRAGGNYHPLLVTEADLAQNFAKSVSQSELILHNSNSVAQYLLSAHARTCGVKAVLTGTGADEFFAGYPSFREDILTARQAATDVGGALNELREKNTLIQIGNLSSPTLPLSACASSLAFVPTWMRDRARMGFQFRELLSRDFRESQSRDVVAEFLQNFDLQDVRSWSKPNISMWLWIRSLYMNKHLTFLGDRMEMAHSIEGRTPLLDTRFVEFAARIPLAMKYKDGHDKFVLREAARPWIPQGIMERPKHLFAAPVQPKGALRELLLDTIASPAFRRTSFFDQEAVTRFMNTEQNIENASDRSMFFLTIQKMASVHFLQEAYGLI